MKRLKDSLDRILPLLQSNEPSSMVLYHLQAIQSLFWDTKEQGIAVI